MLLRVPKDELPNKESEDNKKGSSNRLPVHAKTVDLRKKPSFQLYKQVNMDNAIKKGNTKIDMEIQSNIKRKATRYDCMTEVSYTVFLN